MSFNVSRGNKPQFLSVQISDVTAKLYTETVLPIVKQIGTESTHYVQHFSGDKEK